MGRLLGNFLPYGTLVVNVLGSLALGWLATVFLARAEINVALRLGIAVGFLGAFTTFSAFSFESVQLMLNGAVWRAALNVAANTVVCLGMCYLGMQVGTAGLIFQATGLYKHTLNFSQLNQGEFLAGISLIFLFAAILLCQIFPICSREIFGRSMSDLCADRPRLITGIPEGTSSKRFLSSRFNKANSK